MEEEEGREEEEGMEGGEQCVCGEGGGHGP